MDGDGGLQVVQDDVAFEELDVHRLRLERVGSGRSVMNDRRNAGHADVGANVNECPTALRLTKRLEDPFKRMTAEVGRRIDRLPDHLVPSRKTVRWLSGAGRE